MHYQIFTVTPFQQNCSLLWCDDTLEAALIDPGGEAERLMEGIARQRLTLTKILLTHGHVDHVGAAVKLASRYQVPIVGPHVADRELLHNLPLQCQLFCFTPVVDSFVPNQWLVEGDPIIVGKQYLSVLHCPGHTPGHIVFFCEKSHLVWVGDVLFQGSIGRTDLPGGNAVDLQASIQQKLWPLGDEVTFIPGHGPLSTLGYERRHNPWVQTSRCSD